MLLRIHCTLDRVHHAKLSFSMDLSGYYWVLKIEQHDPDYTSFLTQNGLHQFPQSLCPFGRHLLHSSW